MRFSLRAAPLLLAAVALATSAYGRPTGAMMTRSVYAYSDLERRLEEALGKGDEAAASALVAPNFEFHAQAGNIETRDAWLRREARAHQAGAVRDVFVQESPGRAVVSFVLDNRPKGAAFSVVDVWNSETRRLESRKAQQMKNPPPVERRPTGKE